MTDAINRYARMLESAPSLMRRLKDVSQGDINLSGEIALARTLLEEVVGKFARRYGESDGMLDAGTFGLMMTQLTQVQRIVRDAADIDAKRKDQRLTASHVLMLLAQLRDELVRSLQPAFGEEASSLICDVFTRQKWTGTLDERDVQEALTAPGAYDVKFRLIDRADGTEHVTERAKQVGLSELEAEVLGDVLTGEDEELKRELEEAGDGDGDTGEGEVSPTGTERPQGGAPVAPTGPDDGGSGDGTLQP